MTRSDKILDDLHKVIKSLPQNPMAKLDSVNTILHIYAVKQEIKNTKDEKLLKDYHSTPEPQKKYNASERGRKVRSEWNKKNRQHLERMRGDRTGKCSVCGQSKWLIRKCPPTCRKCNKKVV